MERDFIKDRAMKYICYNWMPLLASQGLDLPPEFYKNAGTSRLHNLPPLDPDKLQHNETIFIKTDYIVNGFFQNHYLHKINKRFNLISGVSAYHLGRDGGNAYKAILDHPHLNKWICSNPPDIDDERIIPMPIGFQEPDRKGGYQEFLEQIQDCRTAFEKKEDGIFLPYHDLNTNPQRAQLFQKLSQLPFVHAQTEKQDLVEYYASLDKYKFVIGLEGRGPDIHRNYETLLAGAIPISIKNVIKRVFDYHEVESVFLNSWDELNNNLFDNLLQASYNITRNDDFLIIDKHFSHLKKVLAEGIK